MDPTTPTPSRPWTRVRSALLHPRACLVLLIVATLWARHDELTTPVGRVRATLTAMITRNLGRDLEELGARAFFYPRLDYAGDQPGYLLQELPLVNLAGIVLEETFDLPRESAYRLPSLIAFAVMLAFLFAFVRARFGTPEALASVLLISYFPLAVYQSMEVMPEQCVLTAFVAGLYAFDRHLDRGRVAPLAAATACFGLMLLVKSTSGLLLLVPVGLYQMRRGTLRGLFRAPHLLAALAAALPLVLWLVHAWRVNRTSVVDDGRTMSELVDNYLDQKERWTQLAAGRTYVGIGNMLATAYERWPLFLCLAGCLVALSRRERGRALLAWWLAAFLAFVVVLPFNLATHWYYTHGYAPLVAVGGALAIGALFRAGIRRVPAAGAPAVQALFAAAALVFVLQARWGFVPPYDRGKHEFGLALQGVLAPRALGILSSEDTGVWDGELFWASDTRGWRASTRPGLSRRPLSEEFVEERRRRGAVFLAHYDPPEKLAARIPELYARLSGKVLVQGPQWIAFSLE